MIPIDWTDTYARLICCTCNQVIEVSYVDWNKAENIAENISAAKWHKCGMRPINGQEVKRAMQQYRAEHPGLTFEEECKVYNEIMKNQTFI